MKFTRIEGSTCVHSKNDDEKSSIFIQKYSENFQISKNFDFWKHFFILYQIQISLQFFCFFFKRNLHLFLGSDQMLNPHISRILFLKYSSVTQIGIGSCTTLQALFLTAAPRMTLYSYLFFWCATSAPWCATENRKKVVHSDLMHHFLKIWVPA